MSTEPEPWQVGREFIAPEMRLFREEARAIKPGDRVLVSLREDATEEHAHRMEALLTRRWPDVEFLIVRDAVTVERNIERPRRTEPVSVQPDWAVRLPIQQQSVLFLAARGPDGMRKRHPAKNVIHAYRACVLNAASVARPLRVSEEGDSFMSAHYLRDSEWRHGVVAAFFDHVDEIPHHYLLHLLHGSEILAYHHPSEFIRRQWLWFYERGCDDMHLPSESRAAMDDRLNDFGRSNGGRQWCLNDGPCDDSEHSLRCSQERARLNDVTRG